MGDVESKDKSPLHEAVRKRCGIVSNIAGVAAIEYAILIALIAVVILGGVSSLGTSVTQNWNNVNAVVDDP